MRRAAGLFQRPDRGLLGVAGGDRVRWLDGMLSNDVRDLAVGPQRSGCYALLLSPKGRILADLHVLERGDRFWLELPADALPRVRAQLERYVIADDVALGDETADWARLTVEGPDARTILARASGARPAVAADCWQELRVAGAALAVGAWGETGGGLQLFVPAGAEREVADALRAAAPGELVEGDAETLEVLRIEAGRPRLGAELDEEVFPAEAGLVPRAVSLSKGCYTGQEIVARLESRARVNHRLVGLRCADPSPPAPGTALADEAGKRVGEVTSSCLSRAAGAIALGFVRLPLDTPGTRLRAGSQPMEVVPLPFVPASEGSGS
jgi:folate-binding protein YgfZ